MAKRLREGEWKKHTDNRFADKPGYPVVEVLWYDALALGVTGWATDTDGKAMPTTTVGYLIKETPDAVTVVSLVNDTHMGHGIVIPRPCMHGELRYL